MRRHHSKGQSSLELLFMVSTGLALVAIMFAVSSSSSSDSLRLSQADDAVKRIGAAADYVYSLGPNSKEYVEVYLPDDIRNVTIANNTLALRVGTSSGASDLVVHTKANLIGQLPEGTGRQRILVQYLDTGHVVIGQSGLECSPSIITRMFMAGNVTGNDTITLANTADAAITGMNATYAEQDGAGNASHVASVASPPAALAAGSTANVTVTYDPAAQNGTYSGVYLVQSGNDGECMVRITTMVYVDPTCNLFCTQNGYSTWRCLGIGEACEAQDYDDLGPFWPCDPDKTNRQKCCCGPQKERLGPIVLTLANSPSSPNITTGANVAVTATCTDAGTGGSNISNATFAINANPNVTVNATQPSSITESIAITYGPGNLTVGSNVVQARCTDVLNNTGPVFYKFFNATT